MDIKDYIKQLTHISNEANYLASITDSIVSIAAPEVETPYFTLCISGRTSDVMYTYEYPTIDSLANAVAHMTIGAKFVHGIEI